MWMQLDKLWSFPFFIHLSLLLTIDIILCVRVSARRQGLQSGSTRIWSPGIGFELRASTASVGIQVVTTDYCRYAPAIKYELTVTWYRSVAVLRAVSFFIYFFKNHASFYLNISTVLQFSISVYVGKDSPFRCGYVKLSYVLNTPCYSQVGFLVFDNNYTKCINYFVN